MVSFSWRFPWQGGNEGWNSGLRGWYLIVSEFGSFGNFKEVVEIDVAAVVGGGGNEVIESIRGFGSG